MLGESAALPPVAAMAGRDERAAAAATGELIRAEILRPDPPLGFVHPLVRDAVYHEVPPAERELEHERAALVLRDAGAGIEQAAAQLLVAPRRGERVGRRAAAARRRGRRCARARPTAPSPTCAARWTSRRRPTSAPAS